MLALADICRWSPSEIMAMPIKRRRAFVDALVHRAKSSRSPDPAKKESFKSAIPRNKLKRRGT